MSQEIFSSINAASTSGTQLATILNNFKDAVVSGLSGTSRPTNIAAGGGWVDTTNAGTPNFYWSYKVYTGTTDVEIFRVNLSTNKASISGADSTFEVTKISADTTAAILKLIKNRVASSGQVADGDVVGEIQFVGRGNDSSNPVVGRIKAVASDNMTASATGTYLVFEACVDGTASLSEMMRLVDSKLGIGLTAPTKTLHVRGTTGIMSENFTDTAVGGIISVKKGRVTGSAPQTSDVIGQYDFRSYDNTAAEQLVAQLVATALENHTTTALGTSLAIKTIAALGTSLTSRMTIGEVVEVLMRLDINAVKLISQDIATASSINQLSADKAIAIMTGSTATSIRGANSAHASKVLVIHNRSSASLTIEHEHASATAADRFKLPDSLPIEILPDSSAEFFYSATDARWKVKSGAGGGGGNLRVTADQALTGGGTLSLSTTAYRQLFYVHGTGGRTTVSTTPFGTGANWKDGAEVILIGTDDGNSVIFSYNDAANGIVGDFDSIELTKYRRISLIYSSTLGRWILNQ